MAIKPHSTAIRNFGQNDTNRNRNGKSAIEAPRSNFILGKKNLEILLLDTYNLDM